MFSAIYGDYNTYYKDFGFHGSRQMYMQAFLLGSLFAERDNNCIFGKWRNRRWVI